MKSVLAGYAPLVYLWCGHKQRLKERKQPEQGGETQTQSTNRLWDLPQDSRRRLVSQLQPVSHLTNHLTNTN